MPKPHTCQATVSFVEMSWAFPLLRAVNEQWSYSLLIVSLRRWTPGMLEADQAKQSALIGFASRKQCSLWGMKVV